MELTGHAWVYSRTVCVHGYTFGLSPNKPGEKYLDAVEALLKSLSASEARAAHDAFMLNNLLDHYEQRAVCEEWKGIHEKLLQLFPSSGPVVLINAMHADQVTVGWLRSDGDFEVLAVFVQSSLGEEVTLAQFDNMVWYCIDMFNKMLDTSDVCGLRREDVPDVLILGDD